MFSILGKLVDTSDDINFTQNISNPFGKLFKFAKRGQGTEICN